MDSIKIHNRLTCAYHISLLRASGSDIGWDMGFELGWSVGMVLGEPVGSLLEVSIIIFIGMALQNYFGTWEGYLVGHSLGALGGLIIGTG